MPRRRGPDAAAALEASAWVKFELRGLHLDMNSVCQRGRSTGVVVDCDVGWQALPQARRLDEAGHGHRRFAQGSWRYGPRSRQASKEQLRLLARGRRRDRYRYRYLYRRFAHADFTATMWFQPEYQHGGSGAVLGESDSDSTVPATLDVVPTDGSQPHGKLRIGRRRAGRQLHGFVDDLAICRAALSGTQIASLTGRKRVCTCGVLSTPRRLNARCTSRDEESQVRRDVSRPGPASRRLPAAILGRQDAAEDACFAPLPRTRVNLTRRGRRCRRSSGCSQPGPMTTRSPTRSRCRPPLRTKSTRTSWSRSCSCCR